jgi:cytochrome c oxidase assembly protein subunit 15
VHVESSRLGRVRSLELTPAAFRRLALAAAAALYVIVVTGSVVRLTSSGLGCESWPGCEAGGFFPEADHHAYVEFGNRVFGLFPITLTLLTWLGARRTAGLPGWATLTAFGTFAGTIAQAPLGLATIHFDLHPLLVMSHFLLALIVLGGAVVVALEAWGLDRGRAAPFVPRELRRAGLVLVAACLALVVTGTTVTAAGPHSGGDDIRRLGSLPDALYVHVRATAVFGCVFLFVIGYLAARRDRSPRLFGLTLGLLGLILVQMAVGEVQWRTELPWGLVLVHVGLAAAIWIVTVALATLLWRPLRLLEPRPKLG